MSTQGGQWPQWNSKSNRIYFVHSDEFFAVDLGPGPVPTLSVPVRIGTRLRTPPAPFGFEWQFLVSDDGRRVLSLISATNSSRTPNVALTENWPASFASRAEVAGAAAPAAPETHAGPPDSPRSFPDGRHSPIAWPSMPVELPLPLPTLFPGSPP